MKFEVFTLSKQSGDPEVESLIEQVNREHENKVIVDRQKFDLRKENLRAHSDDGFGFDILELLTIIDVLVVAVHVAQLTGKDKELIEFIRKKYGQSGGFSFESKELVNNPEDWNGSEVWEWLPQDARSDLIEAYQHLDHKSPKAAILHSTFALEHTIKKFCEIKHGSRPDDIWTGGISVVQANIDPDSASELITDLEFIGQKSEQAKRNDKNIDINDAATTIVFTRKVMRSIFKNC